MTFQIGILVFPNVQQLDLTGPYEVFASVPDARVYLVWKDCKTSGICDRPDPDPRYHACGLS